MTTNIVVRIRSRLISSKLWKTDCFARYFFLEISSIVCFFLLCTPDLGQWYFDIYDRNNKCPITIQTEHLLITNNALFYLTTLKRNWTAALAYVSRTDQFDDDKVVWITCQRTLWLRNAFWEAPYNEWRSGTSQTYPWNVATLREKVLSKQTSDEEDSPWKYLRLNLCAEIFNKKSSVWVVTGRNVRLNLQKQKPLLGPCPKPGELVLDWIIDLQMLLFHYAGQ